MQWWLITILGLLSCGCIQPAPQANPPNSLDPDRDLGSDVADVEDLPSPPCTVVGVPWIQEDITVVFNTVIDYQSEDVSLTNEGASLQYMPIGLQEDRLTFRMTQNVDALPADIELVISPENQREVVCAFTLQPWVSDMTPIFEDNGPVDFAFQGAHPFVLIQGLTNHYVQTRQRTGVWQNVYPPFAFDNAIPRLIRHDTLGVRASSNGMVLPDSGVYRLRDGMPQKISGDLPGAPQGDVYSAFFATPTTDVYLFQDSGEPIPEGGMCRRDGQTWNCEFIPLGPVLASSRAGHRIYLGTDSNALGWDVQTNTIYPFSSVNIESDFLVAGKANVTGAVFAVHDGTTIDFVTIGDALAPPKLASASNATAMAFDDDDRLFVLHEQAVSVFDGDDWAPSTVTGTPVRNEFGQVVLVDVQADVLTLHYPNRLEP